jgi:hypothetical protein
MSSSGYLTDQGDLPFSGNTVESRHASYLGAKAAEPRAAKQRERYRALLREHREGLTDAEAAFLLNVDRTTINARRNECDDVYPYGFRKNVKSGIKNVVWKIR